jgi:two-component system, sensor histidine kinase and response regulator
VGLAICDRQLRYGAVNDALASMSGIPAENHLGKTIHAVLGGAAAKIQPAFEHVFATGQALSNLQNCHSVRNNLSEIEVFTDQES